MSASVFRIGQIVPSSIGLRPVAPDAGHFLTERNLAPGSLVQAPA